MNPHGVPRRRRRGHQEGAGPTFREPTDLSRWIEKKGLPVKDVASLLGVSAEAVYRWASGTRIPDLVVVSRIQEITEGEVEWTSFLNTKLARAIYADLVAHSGGPAHGN